MPIISDGFTLQQCLNLEECLQKVRDEIGLDFTTRKTLLIFFYEDVESNGKNMMYQLREGIEWEELKKELLSEKFYDEFNIFLKKLENDVKQAEEYLSSVIKPTLEQIIKKITTRCSKNQTT